MGPNDVKTLQTKIHDYRGQLQASIDAAARAGSPIASDGSQWSVQNWGDLVGRCTQFENEGTSDWNPLAYIYAGSAYDRGRELIAELDGWRDALAQHKAPNVPDPIPVPNSDLGLAGGIGYLAAAVVAFMVLRELH